MKRRKGRKRATGTRAPLNVPSRPSERWSLDFVSDVFAESRRFRILAVIDDYTRECLGLVAGTAISGARVARELDRLIRLYGKPDSIVSDNGTELTSRAILEWQNETGIGWHYIAPLADRRLHAIAERGQAAAEWLCGKFQRPSQG